MSTSSVSLILLSGSLSNTSIQNYGSETTGFYFDDGLSFTQLGQKKLKLNDGVEFLQTPDADITSAATGYSKLYVNDSGIVKLATTNSLKVAGSSPTTLPNISFSNFTLYGLQLYIGLVAGQCNLTVNSYTGPLGGYLGAVYDPINDRIYLIPYEACDRPLWIYIANDGSVNTYSNGLTIGKYSYCGGVYSDTLKRIYLVPYAISSSPTWHYIDCVTGNVVGYLNGVVARPYAYIGGVRSPKQGRIYFSPYGQATQVNSWHYISESTGNVITYVGASAVLGAYASGVYDPVNNRIYFVPFAQCAQSVWHYVNCTNGSVVGYTNTSGTTGVTSGYYGGCYSITQNRIFFAPYAQSNQTKWHYIDCFTGNVNAYFSGITVVSNAFLGCVYFPTQDRIYFIPFATSNGSSWYYLECNVGGVITGTNIVSYSSIPTITTAYAGGCYSSTQNRLYFVPFGSTTDWIYLSDLESNVSYVDNDLMAGALFNKL